MKKILINGAFDILHEGHIDLINYAKSLGDYLIVGIDTDERIKIAKGNDRPVNTVDIRKKILENIRSVDEVVVFDTDDELLALIASADLRVIGSDWKDKPIVGDRETVKFFDRTNGQSTSNTLDNYIRRRNG